MQKPRIGITIGDINGIGLEVILKTLDHEHITNLCTPIIYGSSKIVSYHKNIVNEQFHYYLAAGTDQVSADKVNVINCWQDSVNISLGKVTREAGQYAAESLEYTTAELRAGRLDAMVTAPINKAAMQLAGFPHPGHTEYLTHAFGVHDSLMMLVSDTLRVGLVTNHLPLADVVPSITMERILRKIELMDQSLRMDFGIEKPTIAVLGLNPHAGDGGALGKEEEELIRPAVIESKEKGRLVMGPFPADGFFGSGQHLKFDGILAMYHDQGLVAFKALSFGQGVNFTAGLPVVRTSPDHGTAFDKAGQNEADPSSFRNAFFLALDIARNRKRYQEDHGNKLEKRADTENQEDEVLQEDGD